MNLLRLLTAFGTYTAFLDTVIALKLQTILQLNVKALKTSFRAIPSLKPFLIATAVFISIDLDTERISPVLAVNLPASNGASGKSQGQLTSLVPIIQLSDAVASALETLPQGFRQCQQKLLIIPSSEKDFKRLFDEFSNGVSYKQKFLDQNAFLVYYTKGFDGPGRPSIEEDSLSEALQKQQYGARNDAWVAIDNALSEISYLAAENSNDLKDLNGYLKSADEALNRYLTTADPTLLKEAKEYLKNKP